MNKNNFSLIKSLYGKGDYTADFNGYKITISESVFSDEIVRFAEAIIRLYPEKLYELALFCKESECFQVCYPDETVETIAGKLHLPVIDIDHAGGMLTYCNHELDSVHLIEVEFIGMMESFCSVNIDG